MPIVAATDVVEIIEPKRQGPRGPGKPPRGFGGGGNGGGSGDSPARPRAYVTGMTVALGGILMFFMALVSAYIVRKGAGADWRALIVPKILWVNTAILVISSFTLSRSRRDFLRNDLQSFRHWWYVTTALGFLFLIGQLIAWRQLANAGVYLASNPSSSFPQRPPPDSRDIFERSRNVLALHGWPVGVSLPTPNSGTVKSEPSRTRRHHRIRMVGRPRPLRDQLQQARHVAVHHLRFADILRAARSLRLRAPGEP